MRTKLREQQMQIMGGLALPKSNTIWLLATILKINMTL